MRLSKPLELAAVVVDRLAALDALGEDAGAGAIQPLLRKLGEATLAFVHALEGNLQLLSAIDQEFERGLIDSVLDVPRRLNQGHETDLAMGVAEGLLFCAPDDMKGEIAIAYALAGDRQRALALVLTNLETATIP